MALSTFTVAYTRYHTYIRYHTPVIIFGARNIAPFSNTNNMATEDTTPGDGFVKRSNASPGVCFLCRLRYEHQRRGTHLNVVAFVQLPPVQRGGGLLGILRIEEIDECEALR